MTTLFASAALLPSGWARDVAIRIENQHVVSVTTGASPHGSDERHACVIPAVANLHSHAFQRAMSGLAERRGVNNDSFWSWRSVMYKFALSMTPDDVEAVAAQLYVEMLEAGFARVGEFHYLHNAEDGSHYANIGEMAERVAAASVEAGIGLTLLPVFYAHAGFGPVPPSEGQRRFICGLDSFAELMLASRAIIGGISGARLGIAPHSLRAVTLDEIGAILPLAEGAPVHIHVAEQMLEVDDCIAATGARPVELLLDRVPVDGRWCLIHATHLSHSETLALAKTGAVAGLCPITEANLGDGIFDAPQFLAAHGRFGVGSDSNVSISLSGELRQLEYSQRLAMQVRNVVADPGASTAQTLLTQATLGGAAAVGGAGGIEAGNLADLLSLDTSAAGHLPIETLLDAFVFGQDVGVGDVWAMGRKLVLAGKHTKREPIRRRFNQTMAQLLNA